MLPWVQLGAATVPGGDVGLRLMQRGEEFSILAGAVELMNSRQSGSEEALASLTCARLVGRRDLHLLIGGLGMGFTLRSALAALPPGARITVAEIAPEVVAWAHGPLSRLHGDSLSDPRVRVIQGDVGDLISAARSAFDAILLDVDNGPEGLMRAANDALYDSRGLEDAKAALRPGGLLSVWSSAPHARFEKRLRVSGFLVEEIRARAHQGSRGARHVVWIAKRP